MALDVTEWADLKHERAHGLVVRCVEDDDSVVRAHRPEFLYDLHPHFLGLRYRRIAAFDRILDITDALVSKLNQSDISSHDFFLSFLPYSKLRLDPAASKPASGPFHPRRSHVERSETSRSTFVGHHQT